MVANKNNNITKTNKNNNITNKKIAAAKGNRRVLEKFSTNELVEYCDSELIRVVKSKRRIINAIHRFWAYESTDSEEYSDSDSSDSSTDSESDSGSTESDSSDDSEDSEDSSDSESD